MSLNSESSRMETAARNTRAGYALVVLATLLMAAGLAFVKASAGELEGPNLVVVKSLLFLLVLFPWAARHRHEASGRQRGGLLAAGLLSGLCMLAQIEALDLIPLSAGVLFGNTTPFWALILVWCFFRTTPRAAEFVWVLVAIGGAALLVAPGGHVDWTDTTEMGMVLALSAGFFNAAWFITLGRVARAESTNTVNPSQQTALNSTRL